MASKPKHRTDKRASDLPAWREASAGEWVCDDEAEMNFLLRMSFGMGFDLVKFDHWLDKIEACPTRVAMLNARARAKAAEQVEEMLPHVQLMWTAKTWFDREDFLVPKAIMGENYSKTQSKRRADKPTIDSFDTSRNERLRAFHARLTADLHRDATAQTALEFGIGERQVRRIVGSKRTDPG